MQKPPHENGQVYINCNAGRPSVSMVNDGLKTVLMGALWLLTIALK